MKRSEEDMGWNCDLEHRLRKTRLKWFGNVKRRDENSILRRVMELEVEGRKLVGRPKKTWSKVVEEDMRGLNIMERIWQRIGISEATHIYHVQLIQVVGN